MTHKVSCIIPAFNEKGRVGRVVSVAKASPFVGEVIVVSDGSTDGTVFEAHEAGADLVIELEENVGKGGAIFEGTKVAKFPILLLLDADLVGLKEEHIEALTTPVLLRKAHMTIGVLVKDAFQQILPRISGQRAVFTDFILSHPDLRESRFRFELLLNHYAKKEKRHVRLVKLRGVTHVMKNHKYDFVTGVRMRYRMGRDMGARVAKNTLQLALALAGLWIYLTVFASFLGRSVPLYPTIPMPTAEDRILVIAAHPDDEILGPAGYLATAAKVGSEIRVVVVTNGDANKFYDISAKRLLQKKPEIFVEEGNVRQRETLAALAELGIPSDRVDFLGFPDRGLHELLDAHWPRSNPYQSPYTKATEPPYAMVFDRNNLYAGEDLADDLAKIIGEIKPTILFTHTMLDTHLDHAATAKFVDLALDALKGQGAFTMPTRYAFLIHGHDYPRPLRYTPNDYLQPPEKIQKQFPRLAWRTFPLDAESENAKHLAIGAFKTQLESPYLNLLLKSFVRRNELFIAE